MARSTYQDVLDEHRRRLVRIAEHRGVRQLKRLYDEAQADLIRKLRSQHRRGLKDIFQAHQHRVVLAQIRDGQAVIARKLVGEMGEISRYAQEEALHGLNADVKRLERHFTGAEITLPTEEAGRFRGVVDGRRQSLLRSHERSMARYGARLVGRMEDELSLSMLEGENLNEAIDRISDVADIEAWQAERIARTESAGAFNATVMDGIADAAEELPGLMSMWSEYVDESGAAQDDRVAVDSLAMAFQVVEPGGVFVMPADSEIPDADGNTEVPKSLAGQEFSFPPSRPNGRETLVAWREEWGIPGWTWDGGARRWLVPLG